MHQLCTPVFVLTLLTAVSGTQSVQVLVNYQAFWMLCSCVLLQRIFQIEQHTKAGQAKMAHLLRWACFVPISMQPELLKLIKPSTEHQEPLIFGT